MVGGRLSSLGSPVRSSAEGALELLVKSESCCKTERSQVLSRVARAFCSKRGLSASQSTSCCSAAKLSLKALAISVDSLIAGIWATLPTVAVCEGPRSATAFAAELWAASLVAKGILCRCRHFLTMCCDGRGLTGSGNRRVLLIRACSAQKWRGKSRWFAARLFCMTLLKQNNAATLTLSGLRRLNKPDSISVNFTESQI